MQSGYPAANGYGGPPNGYPGGQPALGGYGPANGFGGPNGPAYPPLGANSYAPASVVGAGLLSRPGVKLVLGSAALFVVGLLLTIITFAVAEPGGHFVVATGPMIFGFIGVIRGLIRMARG